jgi:hypothetical protein
VPLRCCASQPSLNWRAHKLAWNSLVRIGRQSSICSPRAQCIFRAFCMLLKTPNNFDTCFISNHWIFCTRLDPQYIK